MEDKLQALEKLLQDQLDSQHVKESMSPWNSPIFLVKKISGNGEW